MYIYVTTYAYENITKYINIYVDTMYINGYIDMYVFIHIDCVKKVLEQTKYSWVFSKCVVDKIIIRHYIYPLNEVFRHFILKNEPTESNSCFLAVEVATLI